MGNLKKLAVCLVLLALLVLSFLWPNPILIIADFAAVMWVRKLFRKEESAAEPKAIDKEL